MKKFTQTTLTILFCITLIAGCSKDSSSPSNDPTSIDGGGITGTGGSLARFSIVNDNLYILTQNTLFTYSIADKTHPKYQTSVFVATGAETLFSLDNNLLIGTQNGMLIYTLDNPSKPRYISTYAHVRSCDPVVAKGQYAYSTLRVASNCDRGVNRLDVIDILNINSPKQVSSLDMENPIGLGITEDYLYVCDNNKIKIYSLNNPESPFFQGFTILNGCFDIIIKNDLLIAVTNQGVTQFTIKSDGTLEKLSVITTN
jgi:hypothetical protein